MLSSRSRELLKGMIDAGHPVRIKDLAREFQVSERTIKYDLEAIRLWLKEQNVTLYSQPNKGIWIEEGSEKRAELLCLLSETGTGEVYLNQKERVQHIVMELLFRDDYLRIGDLADTLLVSRNTVISDLREAESFVESWGLALERKARHGLKITGDELKRRLAMENLIQTSLDSSEMYRLIQTALFQSEHPLLVGEWFQRFQLSEEDDIQIRRSMERLANRLKTEMETYISDRVLISVMIRLCLSLQRMHRLHSVHLSHPPLGDERARQIYQLFRRELHGLGQEMGLDIPDVEVSFICLPLIGTTLPPTDKQPEGENRLLDFYSLTAELIELLSSRLRLPLQDDPELSAYLLAHLSDRIVKLQNGVLDPNPFVDDIKRSYPQMYAAVKQECEHIFHRHGIRLLDSDIAYIVLHFQAAYDRMQERKKVNALVVCGTGRGTSRFLKTYLENELKSLRVVGLCSSLEVEKYLATRKVDIIVTVLPLQSSLPVVTVHPLPTRQDIAAIKQLVKELEQTAEDPQQTQRRHTPAYTDLGTDLNERDLPVLERISQDVICRGFELSQKIIHEFREHLTEQAASGLVLHILLMVNRLTFGSPYLYPDEQTRVEQGGVLRDRLQRLLEETPFHLPQSEISAILRYFSLERSMIRGDGDRPGDYEWMGH
ncbi:PRD domain-containing protein [Brevibacillus humidisoli]|uniref:BglG family transcription antiterminator n=1 Tax=Brevibacillus humidisoli TaxID=2895522 RepID=UPI001E2DCC52|nr:PRD domain-containing protein [Brevibacillus humidisoli]UFJ39109.1 PRD domain-containing protein [Brevibacillus humidisoli]